MKVALAPLQSGFVPDVCEMLTVGLIIALIVSVIPLEVAVDVVVQFSLDVITQVTVCPFVIELDV